MGVERVTLEFSVEGLAAKAASGNATQTAFYRLILRGPCGERLISVCFQKVAAFRCQWAILNQHHPKGARK